MKPRLHVLLARNADVGVVIRRGPSKEVASILWNRATDTFSLGQWLKGRIYERRSDLSPDGQHLIYFAMNGHWRSPAKGAWTAISIAPYLKAIALYAKGDCWHGGGLFVDNKTYWLNDGYGHELLEQTTRVHRAPPARAEYGGECMGVYIPRLLRDGWQLRDDEKERDTYVLDKPLWHGWVLRKYARAQIGSPPGKGVYFDEHALLHVERHLILPRSWEWAEVDRGRLVWSDDGALWAGTITRSSAAADEPLAATTQLHDFSTMKFEAIRAPYAPVPKVPKGPKKTR
ncbi:hypothetical protein BH11MYX2_BH11MYX2_18510 [soil metagenome]